METGKDHAHNEQDLVLLQPVIATRRPFYYLALFFLGFTSIAFFAWMYQLKQGLGVTGLNVPVYWGFYITNFVFFIGISHAGLAPWSRRMAMSGMSGR